jgi:hypothetical protein
VLVSSTIGIPPFIATSLLAGALRIRIARFVVAGASAGSSASARWHWQVI